MKRISDVMIGRNYTFYLENSEMENFYLYQIQSPKLNDDLKVLLTLEKVGEHTEKGSGDFCVLSPNHGMQSIDVLATILKSKADIKNRSKELVGSLLSSGGKRGKLGSIPLYDNGKNGFPMWEASFSGTLTKTLIINLRDSLRWNKYKFIDGNFIDILWTPTQHVLFKIKEENQTLFIEPIGLFNNTDIYHKNPINKLNINDLYYPKEGWSGPKRASDLNRAIKLMEWKSFDREIIK